MKTEINSIERNNCVSAKTEGFHETILWFTMEEDGKDSVITFC